MEIKLSKVNVPYVNRKLLMIMKTFIYLLCTTVFGFTSEISFSQEKVTINEDKFITVDEVFEIIKQQTDYKFMYPNKLFKNEPKVQLKRGAIRVDKLLNQSISLSKFNIILSLDGTILVKAKTNSQQKQVSGKVTDESGAILPGVFVLVKGTTNGTTTDFDGLYNIKVSNPENVLVFSFLGFETKEVIVGNQSTIDIVLKESIEALDEVVLTGYQKISKERSTGSFSKPELATLKDRSTSMNVLQRLDGLIPGLTINNAPGSNNILIRGLNTLNGNQEPLLVVDGVVLGNNDISSINPQDVADITVLKDATAASIWGARAANGVIVITTKRGGFNKKLSINYNNFTNFQGKPELDYRPVLSSEQFIQAARETFDPDTFPFAIQSVYDPFGPTRPVKGISIHNQILYDLNAGIIDQATADSRLNALASINNLDQIENLFYENAYESNHTLSLQGGGNKYSFYGSLAYTDTETSNPGEGSDTYKINFRQDFKIGKRINFRLNTDLTNIESRAKRALQFDNRFTPYTLFQDNNGNNLNVNELQFFSNGQREALEAASGINLNYSPLDEVNFGSTNFNTLNARITAGLTIELLNGLNFQGTYGYFQGNARGESFDSADSYQVRSDVVFFTVPSAIPGGAPTYNLPNQGGYYQTNDQFTRNWTVRNQLNYDNNWKDGMHRLTSIAGYEAQEQFFNQRGSFVRGFDPRTLTSQFINYQDLRAGIPGVLVANSLNGESRERFPNEPFFENEQVSRFTSFFANTAYTLNDKYTISGSFRTDQSSLFGIDKSAQNRPVWSGGFKWNMGREDFMDKADWVDNLSLRATYGITGNSPQPGGAASFDILRTDNTVPQFNTQPLGNTIQSPANRTLTWERTTNLNLGVDFTLFKGRLSGSFDYYNNETKDLLNQVPTNTFTGFTSILGNVGVLQNKGIEIALQSLNIQGDFNWTTNVVLAYNKNEITSLNNPIVTTARDQVLSGTPQVGFPAFPIFAYDYIGLNAEGDPEIRLADGTITSELGQGTFEDLLFQGTYQPKWSGGLTNSFNYKGFTLTANMVYNLGHVMFIDTPSPFSFSDQPLEGQRGNVNSGNVHADFANRWKQPGDEANTNIPRYTSNDDAINRDVLHYTFGDDNVTSASYIKLRDISLSYSLPESIIDKLNASNMTFRLMMNNILLWADNDRDIDPEFHNGLEGLRSTRFNQNTVTIGLNLTF